MCEQSKHNVFRFTLKALKGHLVACVAVVKLLYEEFDEKLPRDDMDDLLLLLLLPPWPQPLCLNIFFGFIIFLTCLSGFAAERTAAPAAPASPSPGD